jgi:hypothetical protein
MTKPNSANTSYQLSYPTKLLQSRNFLLMSAILLGPWLHAATAGVFQVAEAFVNGRRVGEHKGTYTGFTFDITDAALTVSNHSPSDDTAGRAHHDRISSTARREPALWQPQAVEGLGPVRVE